MQLFVSFGVGVRTSTMLACAPSVPASVREIADAQAVAVIVSVCDVASQPSFISSWSASVPTASSWDCAIVTGRSKVTSYSPVAEPFATVGFAASPPANTSVTPDPQPPPLLAPAETSTEPSVTGGRSELAARARRRTTPARRRPLLRPARYANARPRAISTDGRHTERDLLSARHPPDSASAAPLLPC